MKWDIIRGSLSHRGQLVLAVVVAGVLGFAGIRAESATTTQPSYRTGGTVQELVAASGRVGLVVAGPRHVAGSGQACSHAVLWTPAAHKVFPLSSATCGSWTPRASVFGLTVAGDRAFWVRSAGGNTYETNLVTRTSRDRTASSIAFGSGFAGNARADGGTVVFNTYNRCLAGAPCPPDVSEGSIYGAFVWRYVGGKSSAPCPTELNRRPLRACRLLASSPRGELTILSLAGGKVAVRTETGDVHLLSAVDGRLLASYSYPPNVVRAAALDTRTLVVLRPGFLERHILGSGLGPASWPVPRVATYGPASPAPEIRGDGPPRVTPELTLESISSGYVVYVVHHGVHLVRLSDGRDVVVARLSAGAVHAQLQHSGLYIGAGHTVSFMPMAELRRKIR